MVCVCVSRQHFFCIGPASVCVPQKLPFPWLFGGNIPSLILSCQQPCTVFLGFWCLCGSRVVHKDCYPCVCVCVCLCTGFVNLDSFHLVCTQKPTGLVTLAQCTGTYSTASHTPCRTWIQTDTTPHHTTHTRSTNSQNHIPRMITQKHNQITHSQNHSHKNTLTQTKAQ